MNISVLVAAAGFGLNNAVTPLGNADVDRLTVLLKPNCGVTVIVLDPVVPCEIVKLVGADERVKFGALFTVKVSVAVLVRLPDVPVMVTGTVPVVAELLAVSVIVLVFVVGFGLNDAVTPLGKPDANRLTLALKLFCGVMVIVPVPVDPCVMVKLLGEEETVKFPVGFMVRPIVIV
jgi:hypothetical protein